MCLIHLFRPILEFSRMEIKYPVAMPVAILKCFLSPLYLGIHSVAGVVLTAAYQSVVSQDERCFQWDCMLGASDSPLPGPALIIVASSSLILLILRYHSVSCTRDSYTAFKILQVLQISSLMVQSNSVYVRYCNGRRQYACTQTVHYAVPQKLLLPGTAYQDKIS